MGETLIHLTSSLKKQAKSKGNFKVTSKGLSRLVEFDSGTKFRYFGGSNMEKSRVKGAYFSTLVKKSIDKYIEKQWSHY